MYCKPEMRIFQNEGWGLDPVVPDQTTVKKRTFQMTLNDQERPEESLLDIIVRLVLVVFYFGVSCVTCSNVVKHNPSFKDFLYIKSF